MQLSLGQLSMLFCFAGIAFILEGTQPMAGSRVSRKLRTGKNAGSRKKRDYVDEATWDRRVFSYLPQARCLDKAGIANKLLRQASNDFCRRAATRP